MENSNRSRVWFCTAYAHIDELYAEAQHVLRNLNGFITAYHDKDVKEDGSPKEPHYHIMISNPNAISYNTVQKIFQNVMKNHPGDNDNFKVDEMKGSWGQASAYMLHNDSKSIKAGKHQYTMESVTEYTGKLNETPQKNAADADCEPAKALMKCIAYGYSFTECVIQFGAFAIYNYKRIAEGLLTDCPKMDEVINRPKHTQEELYQLLEDESVSRETSDWVDDFRARGENSNALLEAHLYLEEKNARMGQDLEEASDRMANPKAEESSYRLGKNHADVRKKAEKSFSKAAIHAVQASNYTEYDEDEIQTCPDDIHQNESDDLKEDCREELEMLSETLSEYSITMTEAMEDTAVQMIHAENYDTASCLEVLKLIGSQQ